MPESEICALGAREMARLIRTGELSARETLEAHLDRIERVNPKVNAIVTLDAEGARLQAAACDEARTFGPLHGLPVVHKDLQPTAGMRTTFGSRIFADFVPTTDSLLVERVKAAGAVSMGKTNTPEFGAGSQTFNEVFGATLNPWDTTKTCGGSSGGAAVALACHMTPLADGSDLGGSLRNPASFCGVCGIRTSPGRVPVWPNLFPWSPLGVEGPMARSVDDLALFLSAMAGPDARAPLSLAEPGEKFAGDLGRDFKGMRVAWWKDLGGAPFDPAVVQIVNAQWQVFEALGCVVEEAEPDFREADAAFRTLRFHMTGVRMGGHAKKAPHLVKDTLLWEVEQASRLTAADVGEAEVALGRVYQRARSFFERYEFFVLPVVQVLPFDIGLPWPDQIGGQRLENYLDWMKSCYLISALGTPALSVPAGFTADGLPVGLQIVARHRDDFGLLQVGRAFEIARGELARINPGFGAPCATRSEIG